MSNWNFSVTSRRKRPVWVWSLKKCRCTQAQRYLSNLTLAFKFEFALCTFWTFLHLIQIRHFWFLLQRTFKLITEVNLSLSTRTSTNDLSTRPHEDQLRAEVWGELAGPLETAKIGSSVLMRAKCPQSAPPNRKIDFLVWKLRRLRVGQKIEKWRLQQVLVQRRLFVT